MYSNKYRAKKSFGLIQMAAVLQFLPETSSFLSLKTPRSCPQY